MSDEQIKNNQDEPVPNNPTDTPINKVNDEVTTNNVIPPQEQTITNITKNQSSKNEPILIEIKKQKWSIPETMNAIIALGTIVAVIVSIFSLKISNESLVLTKAAFDSANISSQKAYEATIEDLRARIVVESITISEVVPDCIVNFSIKYKNNGNTTASIVKMGIAANIGPNETYKHIADLPEIAMNAATRTLSISSMGTNETITTPLSSPIVPKNDYELLKAGIIHIYIASCVTYYDIFQRPRYIHIFGKYDFSSKVIINSNSFNDAN